uniref:Golgi SNAP receptor complex member 2 n=1 Tax=Lygus hesperus TaxID=30085 RepID=A0A0A9YXC4_LYGHE
MEALYHQTNGLVQETQECFRKLEHMKGSSNTMAIEKEIQGRIDSITSNCEKLDIMVNKEPAMRRQNAKLRIDQLKYDNRHLQAALRMYQHEVNRRQEEEREREELLTRRFTTNAASERATAIQIDHSLQHHDSLLNANRGVDDLLMSGSSILENMRDQRNTLKGARRRMMDIANTLGLSNSTMRFIERRAVQDKYILVAGMAVTSLIVILMIIYLT